MTIPDWMPPIADLRQVIPVVREVERRNGGRMIVASIELWADATIVHYATSAEDLDNPLTASAQQIGLTDDVGTEYRLAPGSSSGTNFGEQLGRHHAIFRPATPDIARHLTFASTRCDETITVEV